MKCMRDGLEGKEAEEGWLKQRVKLLEDAMIAVTPLLRIGTQKETTQAHVDELMDTTALYHVMRDAHPAGLGFDLWDHMYTAMFYRARFVVLHGPMAIYDDGLGEQYNHIEHLRIKKGLFLLTKVNKDTGEATGFKDSHQAAIARSSPKLRRMARDVHRRGKYKKKEDEGKDEEEKEEEEGGGGDGNGGFVEVDGDGDEKEIADEDERRETCFEEAVDVLITHDLENEGVENALIVEEDVEEIELVVISDEDEDEDDDGWR